MQRWVPIAAPEAWVIQPLSNFLESSFIKGPIFRAVSINLPFRSGRCGLCSFLRKGPLRSSLFFLTQRFLLSDRRLCLFLAFPVAYSAVVKLPFFILYSPRSIFLQAISFSSRVAGSVKCLSTRGFVLPPLHLFLPFCALCYSCCVHLFALRAFSLVPAPLVCLRASVCFFFLLPSPDVMSVRGIREFSSQSLCSFTKRSVPPFHFYPSPCR